MDRPLLLIDVDGVCRNFVPSLVKIYVDTFGEKPVLPIKTYSMNNSFPRVEDPVDFFFKQKENARYVFRESPMIDGCADSIGRISSNFAIEFVTAQFDGNEGHTIHWLKRYGLGGYPIVFSWEKHKIEGDALVDDAPHNLRDFEITGRPGICFTQPYNWDWKGLRVMTWWHLELLLEHFPTLQFRGEENVGRNSIKKQRKSVKVFA